MQKYYDHHNPLLLNSEILLGSLEAAAELDVDLTEPLSHCDIDPGLLESPTGFLAFHKVVYFLEDVAKRYNCPHFGFLVGKHQPPLRFGATAQISKLAPNLQSAIDNGIHYSLLNSEESLWQIKCEAGYAYVTRHNRIAFEDSLVQLHTLAVTLVFKALMTLSDGRLKASYISFAHAKPKTHKLYEKFFNVPIHFDSECDGIVFPEGYLQLAVKTADSELFSIVKSYLDSVNTGYTPNDDIPTKTSYYIKKNIGTAACSIEGISQLLNQHPRTLQRQLKDSGVTFRQLLLDARQEVAEHYLRSSSLSLSALADILGYRNVSAFSRAFKSNSGVSPAQWRLKNTLSPRSR